MKKARLNDTAKSWLNYLKNHRHEENVDKLKNSINLLVSVYNNIKNHDLSNIDITELNTCLDNLSCNWEKLLKTEKEINALSFDEIYCVYDEFENYRYNYQYVNGILD